MSRAEIMVRVEVVVEVEVEAYHSGPGALGLASGGGGGFGGGGMFSSVINCWCRNGRCYVISCHFISWRFFLVGAELVLWCK